MKPKLQFEGTPVVSPTTWDIPDSITISDSKLFVPSQSARTEYLLEPIRHEEMFNAFINIQDKKQAKSYLLKYGIPLGDYNDRNAFVKRRVYASEIIESSASMRWLNDFRLAIKNEDSDSLLAWLKEIDTSNAVTGPNDWSKLKVLTFQPDTTSPSYKNWKGIYITDRAFGNWCHLQTLDLNDGRSPLKYPWWTFPKTFDIKKDRTELIAFASNFLRCIVNRCMTGISPGIEFKSNAIYRHKLIPYFQIQNPWQAICLTLYLKITGANRQDICPHPKCDRFIPLREGARTCERSACKKWATKNLGKINQYPSRKKIKSGKQS